MLDEDEASEGFPTVDGFFGGFANEDMLDFYKDWQGAVDACAALGGGTAARAAAQLTDMLSLDLTEDELDIVVGRMGSAYDPTIEDGGFRVWLTAIRDRFAAIANAKQA